MKRKLVYLSALVLGLAMPKISRADVQPVVLFFGQYVTNYTVPAGKVLVIEHVCASGAFNTPTAPRILIETKIFNISNGGVTTMDWGYTVTDQYQDVTLTRPLRIPAGGNLGINYANNIAYNQINLMGLLIDATDLYAANVGGNVDNIAASGGTLSATVNLASARPVRTSSKTSTDLVNWTPGTPGQLQRTTAPSVWTIQTAADGKQKFVQVTAKAPESTPVVPQASPQPH